MLPPRVARLRIRGEPSFPAASARTKAGPRSLRPASSTIRVRGPIFNPLLVRLSPARLPNPWMETTWEASSRPVFRFTSRSVPPARILALFLNRASSSRASAWVLGAWYSKRGSSICLPPEPTDYY